MHSSSHKGFGKMKIVPITVGFAACAVAAWALFQPDRVNKEWVWILWALGPPIWFILEYLAVYHGWFGPKVTQGPELEHHRHLQSLFTGLWVAIAALLYWRLFDKP